MGSEFFRTFGISILRGRGFAKGDRGNAPKVAVVSRAVAERLWPGRDPIGQRIRLTFEDEWRTVVGVAGDSRYERLREPTPMIYLPWRQFPIFRFVWTVGVRTEEDLASFVSLMRQTISDSNSRIVVWRAETMNDYLAAGPLVQPRTSAFVFSGFGVAALMLAAIGLYGVLALEVREQTRDLGVRMALGATPQRLRRHVMRNTFALTATGVAAGVGVALAGSRLLAALLFEVSPTDLTTLFGVCILFFTVALVAAYLPARRATRVDPMQALRAD